MSMPRMILATLLGLSFSWEMPVTVEAAAPQRTGQPYAEATLCARADVILCEDFNYPTNFLSEVGICGTGCIRDTWINPAVVKQQQDFQAGGQSRQINPASQYGKPVALPSGPQPDSVWVANWDPAKGNTGHGATQGVIRNPGGNYANGMAPTKDVYIRFRYYVTPNYAWPGDPRTSVGYSFCCNAVDNKILFIYPPECVACTSASYDAGLYTHSGMFDGTNAFSDALGVRIGNADCNYKWFPLGKCQGGHPEYGPFQSLTLRNPHDTPRSQKVFRFDTDRWYTLEIRYKLSDINVPNGTVQVWINGVLTYDASDESTCGIGGLPSDGDCSGIGAINIVAYHNAGDRTVWNGQQVIDDLVIATKYIGPPTTGSASTTPPAAPTKLQAQ